MKSYVVGYESLVYTLVWQVISLLFFYFSLRLHRYLGDGGIGTDRREILHDGTYRSRTESLPFWGGAPRGTPNPQFWG